MGWASDAARSLEISEVVSLELTLVTVSLLVLAHFPSEILAFKVERVELLFAGAVDLVLHTLVEAEVVHDGLLLLHLDLAVVHGLGLLGDLSLEGRLLADSHAKLGKLVENLEVGEEGGHIARSGCLRDSFKERTFHATFTNGLVHRSSHFLEPRFIRILREALLDVLAEKLRVHEDRLTVSSKRSIRVLLDELADAVEDLASGTSGSGLVGGDDLLHVGEGVLVAGLEELGLLLIHRLDHLLDIVQLLSSLSLGLLLGVELGLKGLQLAVCLIESVLDLLAKRRGDTSARLARFEK